MEVVVANASTATAVELSDIASYHDRNHRQGIETPPSHWPHRRLSIDMNLLDHPLMKCVKATIDDRCRGMVVGVSGGADSVALANALPRLRRRPERTVIAHLDHALRPDSANDARWVNQLATSLEIPAIIERHRVAVLAAEQGIGHEEAARKDRYDFLCRIAREHDCSHIAVGHTADDQAETVLHQLVRGSGLAGLRGMPVSRDLDGRILVRPLLLVLERIGQSYLTDETNSDESYTRNRVRHSLLPLLQEQFNPQVIPALCRLSRQARDAQELVETTASDLLTSAMQLRESQQAVLDTRPLREAPRHLVRETFRLLFVMQDWPRQRMGFDDWDRLAELAQSARSPKSLTLPEQLRASYRRGRVRIESGQQDTPSQDV